MPPPCAEIEYTKFYTEGVPDAQSNGPQQVVAFVRRALEQKAVTKRGTWPRYSLLRVPQRLPWRWSRIHPRTRGRGLICIKASYLPHNHGFRPRVS